MIKHMRLVPFVCGLVIGIFAVLYVKPEETVVRKYPTPETAKDLVYKDKNGVCYKYTANKVDCDKNEARLKDFPLSK